MKYLKVFTDFATSMDGLSDAEKGRLFAAMLRYAETAEAPDLRGGERILWPVAKQMIDREFESYDKLCERNRKNGATGGHWDPLGATGGHTAQDKDNTYKEILPKGSREKAGAFSRPTVEEITEYCLEAGISVDANKFVDHYSSNGWKVGRVPMKDWKATVRTWARRERDEKGGKPRESRYDTL